MSHVVADRMENYNKNEFNVNCCFNLETTLIYFFGATESLRPLLSVGDQPLFSSIKLN